MKVTEYEYKFWKLDRNRTYMYVIRLFDCLQTKNYSNNFVHSYVDRIHLCGQQPPVGKVITACRLCYPNLLGLIDFCNYYLVPASVRTRHRQVWRIFHFHVYFPHLITSNSGCNCIQLVSRRWWIDILNVERPTPSRIGDLHWHVLLVVVIHRTRLGAMTIICFKIN